MKTKNKRQSLGGLLVAALVYLDAENYEACKKTIETAVKHLDDKLEIS